MDSLTSFRATNVGHDHPPAFGLSRAFGWFSLGLGATQLAAPRMMARLVGVEPGLASSIVMRAVGLREVVTGVGILMRPRRPVPMWARVVGDAIDLGLLAWAAASPRSNRARVAAAMAAVAGAAALDAYASQRVTRAQDAAAEPVMFSVTIHKSPAEVYAFFRDLANLPTFMDYLASVREIGGGRSHWVAKLPVRGTIEWDAEVTEDRPGERIAWQTVAGSTFAHRGQVTFADTPGGGGSTEVRVELEVGLPGIAPSASLAKLLTKPQIKGDLRRLKQVMETGEVLFSDASAHRIKHPAQPSVDGARHARERADAGHRVAVEKGLVP